MSVLLDVNVLVALLDPNHLHHRTAWASLADHGGEGWATCPITENGAVRILSQARYPGGGRKPEEAVGLVRALLAMDGHQFWPDDQSIVDERVIDPRHLQGPKQLTDAYLLALAVKRDGRLLSLDHGVPMNAVRGASAAQLIILKPSA